jgi:hypothetical protein
MDAKLKHLEFIQAVISRMATNSFLFKGWAITIAAGVSGLAAVSSKAGVTGVAIGTTLLFWGLDAYYLQLERAFRDLYDSVAGRPETDIDFSMRVDRSKARSRFWEASWRPHIYLFYGAIIVADIVTIFVVKGT